MCCCVVFPMAIHVTDSAVITWLHQVVEINTSRTCSAKMEEVATVPLRNGLTWRNSCQERSTISIIQGNHSLTSGMKRNGCYVVPNGRKRSLVWRNGTEPEHSNRPQVSSFLPLGVALLIQAEPAIIYN